MTTPDHVPQPVGVQRLALLGGTRSRLAGLAVAIAYDRVLVAAAAEAANQDRADRALSRAQVDSLPERGRRGQLLWLQPDGTRTSATGGRGRR